MTQEGSDSQRRRHPAEIEVPEGRIRILESHHAMDFEMEMGVWSFHKICWVAVGRGSFETPDSSVGIQHGDFLLIPSDWPHRFVDAPGEPLTLVVFCISRNYFSGRNDAELVRLWNSAVDALPPGQPFCAITGFHHTGLIEIFRLAMREQGRGLTGWQTALAASFDRLLLCLGRGYCEPREEHVDSSMRTVSGAIDYIDSHLYEPLQIGRMAERCNLSPRRFTDLFKTLTGETFNQHVSRKRIQYACERLDETGNILYACHESGFSDVAYFYRVFKKLTGKTPGQYLKSNDKKRFARKSLRFPERRTIG